MTDRPLRDCYRLTLTKIKMSDLKKGDVFIQTAATPDDTQVTPLLFTADSDGYDIDVHNSGICCNPAELPDILSYIKAQKPGVPFSTNNLAAGQL